MAKCTNCASTYHWTVQVLISEKLQSSSRPQHSSGKDVQNERRAQLFSKYLMLTTNVRCELSEKRNMLGWMRFHYKQGSFLKGFHDRHEPLRTYHGKTNDPAKYEEKTLETIRKRRISTVLYHASCNQRRCCERVGWAWFSRELWTACFYVDDSLVEECAIWVMSLVICVWNMPFHEDFMSMGAMCTAKTSALVCVSVGHEGNCRQQSEVLGKH